MKIIIFLSLLLFSLSDDSLSGKRAQFVQNIRNFIPKYSLPSDHAQYVESIQTSCLILFNSIDVADINKVQRRFSLSNELTQKIKAVPYLSGASGYSKIDESVTIETGRYKESVGAAFKDENGKITFALIAATSRAKNVPKYETSYRRVCHKTWIFFDSCHDEPFQVEVAYTVTELEKVKSIVQYYNMQYIQEHINILSDDDFEIYMTEGNSITSDDGQSLAYITDFGDIAIGPASEVNVLKPVEKYKFSTTYKDLYGSIQNCFTNKSGQRECCSFNPGQLNKFTFLLNSVKHGEFLCDAINKLNTKRANGPYALEITRNGTILLFNTRTKVRQFNLQVGRNYPGPYDLYVSNDRTLNLACPTRVLFTLSYKDFPTVFYDFNLHNNVTNGQINSGFIEEYYQMGSIMLSTDDAVKYPIEIFVTYGDYNKITHTVISNQMNPTYNIPAVFHKQFGATSQTVEVQKIMTHHYYGTNGVRIGDPNRLQAVEAVKAQFLSSEVSKLYDLCYSLYITRDGWTKFGCNNVEVGVPGNIEGKGSHGAIFIVKPKGQALKDITGYKL